MRRQLNEAAIARARDGLMRAPKQCCFHQCMAATSQMQRLLNCRVEPVCYEVFVSFGSAVGL